MEVIVIDNRGSHRQPLKNLPIRCWAGNICVSTTLLSPVHLSTQAGCGFADGVSLYNWPMLHAHQSSRTLSASLPEMYRPRGTASDHAGQSVVRHAAETVRWPPVDRSLRQLGNPEINAVSVVTFVGR